MSSLSEGEFQVFEIPEFSDKKTLQEKIQGIVWPNELEQDYGWSLGAPTWAVKPLVQTWSDTFDWDEPRAEMNRWHHYRMKIDGLLIHYVHERSSRQDAIPIVLLHGWPSTFYEFHKLIDPLRDGTDQAFHVIVPSLPGFGFSEAPKVKGYGVEKIAGMINQLMIHLGYDKYSKWQYTYIVIKLTEKIKCITVVTGELLLENGSLLVITIIVKHIIPIYHLFYHHCLLQEIYCSIHSK